MFPIKLTSVVPTYFYAIPLGIGWAVTSYGQYDLCYNNNHDASYIHTTLFKMGQIFAPLGFCCPTYSIAVERENKNE